MTNNPLTRTKTSPATSLFFFKSIFDCQLEKEIHNWFLRESLMCTFDFTVTLRIHRNNSWAPVSSQRREEQNCIQRSCRSFRIILCLWTCQPFLERLRLSWGFFMWLLSGWGRRGTAVIDTHWPLHRTLRAPTAEAVLHSKAFFGHWGCSLTSTSAAAVTPLMKL